VITQLQHLQLAAVNLDGVLLNDTFSPAIRQFVTSHGGNYTPEFEYQVLSRNRTDAAKLMSDQLHLDWPPERINDAIFRERDTYLVNNPATVDAGAINLLERLHNLQLRLICYGGLDREHFDEFLGTHTHLFQPPTYVCTNDFRPGLRQITVNVFGLNYSQAVFIDDVASVAQEAKILGIPFVGHPANEYQRSTMRRIGVRHIVGSLAAIDDPLLFRLDAEASSGTIWQDPN
jgi:beta-phosphoglucomutase-like phosphatase (HAD superfamily)